MSPGKALRYAKENPLKVGLFLVPGFGLLMIGLLYALYLHQTLEIQASAAETEQRLCLNIAARIEADLLQAKQLTHSLANLASLTRGQTGQTEALLKRVMQSAPRPLVHGLGIWYEPGRFTPGTRLHGCYVHREGKGSQALVLTYEWSSENYNYPTQAWYRQGIEHKGLQSFTPPYPDAGHTYVSSVQSLADEDGRPLGVVTVDVTLESIRAVLEEIPDERTQIALTLPGGRLLFHSHEARLLEKAREAGLTVNTLLELPPEQLAALEEPGRTSPAPGTRHRLESIDWTLHVQMRNPVTKERIQALRSLLFLLVLILALPGVLTLLSLRRHQRRIEHARQLQTELAELQAKVAQKLGNERRQQRRRVLYEGIIRRRTTELARINENKDQLISVLAHDMRSHFLIINSYATLLDDPELESDPQARKSAHANILKSTLHAIESFEALLLWVRLQANRVSHASQAVEWRQVLSQVRGLLEAQAQVKGVRLVMEEPRAERLQGNQELAATLLRNLVGNAIKFTPSGGLVRVRVAERSSPPEFELSIEDTGVGMPPEQASIAFTRRELRSRPGTAGEKGTGLGLVICHEMCLLMKGNITLRSQLGVGTTVTVRLPRPDTDTHRQA